MNLESNTHFGGEPVDPRFRIMVPTEDHGVYAGLVSSWTQGAEQMLPKTQEEIMKFFKQGHSVLVFEGEALISHAAATYMYSDGSIEIGAMYTHEEHRGKKAVTTAVHALLEIINKKYPERMKFALANDSSAHVFEKMGATVMTTDELSKEVWEPCVTCPKNVGGSPFHCCDTPYNLTDIL